MTRHDAVAIAALAAWVTVFIVLGVLAAMRADERLMRRAGEIERCERTYGVRCVDTDDGPRPVLTEGRQR